MYIQKDIYMRILGCPSTPPPPPPAAYARLRLTRSISSGEHDGQTRVCIHGFNPTLIQDLVIGDFCLVREWGIDDAKLLDQADVGCEGETGTAEGISYSPCTPDSKCMQRQAPPELLSPAPSRTWPRPTSTYIYLYINLYVCLSIYTSVYIYAYIQMYR